MRKVTVFLFALFCSLCAIACVGESGTASSRGDLAPTVIVEIDEELNVANQARLAKAVRVAQERTGSWLIVAIDTPGGDIETMGAMGKTLRDAARGANPITTVAFVKSGKFGGAWSAGSFLAIACQKIYMENGAQMGAALPVVGTMTPNGFALASADRFADGKIISMLSARFREYAKETGRPEALAAAFVDPRLGVARVRLEDGAEGIFGTDEIESYKSSGRKLTILKEYQPPESDRPLVVSAERAFEAGFSQGIVSGIDDLLTVVMRDSAPKLIIAPFPGERFVAFISMATPVLLLLGLILGFLEAKIPGFGVAGILSTLCFGLVFYGRYLLGAAEILHGVLFVLGLALLAIEIFFVTGTIIPGVFGGILIAMSLIMAFIDPIIPRDALDAEFMTRHLAWGSGIFLSSVVAMYVLSKFLPHTPLVRRMVLPPPGGTTGGGTQTEEFAPLLNKLGVAATDLRPAGIVDIDGLRVDATAVGSFVTKGSAVRVTEVAGSRIVVAAERDSKEK
ncbi:MAG: hypothetical protein HY286_14725 [Planctomycetes bacterium]|nr:hypothetical protein [Planctomycetota bacterium]